MSEAPKKPGLDGRARDKSGQIDYKHPPRKSSTCANTTESTSLPIGTESVPSASY
jgi:hypothetical protein